MTQADFARAVGVSTPYISQIRTGRYPLTKARIIAWSRGISFTSAEWRLLARACRKANA